MARERINEDRERRGRLFDAAVVIATVPVVAAGVRVWLYSGGDSSLFLLLLRTLDIPAALIASAVLVLPFFLVFAILILLTDWRARDWTKSLLERHQWAAFFSPALVFILIYTGNVWFWLFLVGIGLTVVIYFLVKRLWPWAYKNILTVLVTPRGDNNGPASLLTISILLIVTLISPSNMWLPLERVQLSDSSKVVGYVLEDGPDWTTLVSHERKVEVVRADEVERREVCRPGAPVSLATLLFSHDLSSAPDCSRATE